MNRSDAIAIAAKLRHESTFGKLHTVLAGDPAWCDFIDASDAAVEALDHLLAENERLAARVVKLERQLKGESDG